MKKIMILGAGIYQVPLIQKAKEMGLFVIVASIKGNYPGFAFADKIYYVDTTDKEHILEIAQKEKIDGICTTGTDVAVSSIGYVCDELGLTGVSLESALCASDKNLMKKKFRECGVNTAKYYTVYCDDNIETVLDELQFPVIFKAVDSSGSRGIVKVSTRNNEEIIQAIEIVKSVTRKDYFIVEEFIEGEEFGAQALISHGQVKFIMPHGDYVYSGNTGVPIGHFVPYDLTQDLINKIYNETEKSLKAIGIDDCAVNMDFIMRNDEIYVLEIGARAGATCLPEMVSIYYGIDYYELILKVALGEIVEKIDENNKLTPNACKLLMSEKSGTIKNIIIPENKESKVLDISMDYSIGDSVKKFNIGPDRIGQVITYGETLEEAVNILEKTYSEIKIDVE